MAEPVTPLLDEHALQAAQSYSPPQDVNLPNLPFRGFDTSLLPSEGGKPTPSALSALENKLFSISNNGDGKLTGGSIPRSLAEVSSDRYDQYVPGDYNNEEAYALGQGWPSKMINGVGKGLSLTATTFLQSTAGLVNGIAKAASDGRAASFYDNEFNRNLDEFNKQLENILPNYYTDGEKNANWYSPKKLVTANFLWDGIVKNMGFAAGAYLSGGVYATGLKSLSALPGMTKLFSVGRAAETLAATEEALQSADKAASTYGQIESLSNKFLSTYNVLNKGQRALVAGLATTGEAGFEAYYNLNDFRDRKIQEYKDTHDGWGPIGADLDAINSASDSVGNSSFLLNTALLTATNYIQFPKILGSSDKAERSLIASTTTKEIGDITKNELGQFVKQEAKTRGGRILSSINGIRPYLFSTSEGFEEGAQYAISQGVDDYYNKKYHNQNTDWLESVFKGINQTVGTNEGMENVLIGGLSGALMLGRGRFQESSQIKQNTADAIAKFNNFQLSDFTKGTVDAVNRGTVLQQEREDSLRRGDVLEAKDKEQDYIINYLSPRIKYGRYDLVQSDINQYKQLASTQEGYSQLQSEGKALQGDSRGAYLQRLANLEDISRHIKGLYESLQIRYGNLTKDGKPVYSPEVIDKMVYASSKMADYDKRIPQISTSLALKGIITSDITNDIVKGKAEKYNEALSQIENLDINDDEKESLVRDLDDVSELALRRQFFLGEYNSIKKVPEKFKDIPTPAVIPGKEETIQVKTKDGEEKVVVGEEYFLGKTVEYDKSGKEVYRFPRITILGENEDGTIKVKDGRGNIKDVSKAVLEDYKLGKVSYTLSNKKAKFYFDHINDVFEFNFGKGKKQKGRLEYSSKDKILNFVYKDKKGKVKNIEVTGDQFIPKKGYNHPMISKVGEITPVQQKSLDEFSSEEDSRTSEKRASRLKILTELFDEVSNRHEKTKSLITEKQSILENITKELSELQAKIKDSEFTKKNRFKARSRRALEAAMKLSRMQDQLKDEIVALEAERDETEINVSYITDLIQNIDELPTNTKEFLQELKEQKSNLESLILETGKEINTLSKLIDGVKGALDSAVSYLRDIINDFKTLYPKAPLVIGQEWVDFLKTNPNFLKKNPDYKDMLSKVEELVSQVEDLDITPNERTLNELVIELKSLQTILETTEKELKAKDLILSKFEEVAEKYKRQKEEEQRMSKNKTLQKELLGSADPGLQTVTSESSYEPKAKKSDITIVTSTKTAGKSILPHHVRANKFGANLDKFENRQKIKGVLITSKNEEKLGLKGLTTFLKGTSDVDASKIVAVVMVEKGIPVGEDGKPLEFPSFDNIIVQVMPDPKLEWSEEFGGGTMFRKETTPEQIEYYKKQYTEWVNKTLKSTSLKEHPISASFGVPEYVTYLDEKGNIKRDFKAKTSVEEAGLIESSILVEKPVIFIPTTDTTVEKGSVSFASPLGRPFLDLSNGYVKLDNRKLTEKEAATIYEATYQLAKDIFDNGDAQSEKSKRLMNWLKSIIYWGSPKNAAGFNSIWFSTINGQLSLSISGKDKTYSFIPSSIEDNKEEIIGLLEGMYNNVNSGLINKPDLWNAPYEQILSISPEGVIEGKQWQNYQTYLLSKEGRKSEELPLSTNMKPIGEEGVNRHGIYFTLTDTVDNYENVPKTPIVAPTPQKETSKEGYVLDGKTSNTYTSPEGKVINFKATSDGKISVLKGGDVDEVVNFISTKSNVDLTRARAALVARIKEDVTKQLPTETPKTPRKNIFGEETNVPSKEAPKKSIFDKSPTKEGERKPAIITSSPIEDRMEFSVDDIDEDTVLRVVKEEPLKYFNPENWEETAKWLKSNFPNVPVYRVKNVIQATNGIQAWGMFKNGSIYVYENAEVGTVYHEVFEAVWKMFSDKQEQSDVLNEFKNRTGSFVDRPTGRTIEYSEATDLQAKEQLAEEFRDFVLNKKVPQKAKGGKHFIIKLFNDLVDFIRSFFSGNKAKSNTEKLFNKIGRGYYKQVIPHQQQLSFANSGFINIEQAYADNFSEFRIENIPADVVNEIMQHMTYLTLTDLIKDNKSLFSIPKIGKEELYTKLKTRFTKIAEQSGEWDNLVKKHQEYLKSYSIEFDDSDDIILKDEDASKKGDYQEANKIDVFKKANSAVKLLLSTIPIVDENNKRIRSSIGGVRLLPTSQVFMALMNNIHTSRSIDEMMNRLKEMSEEDNNYKTLYERLTKNTSDLSEISEVHDGQLLAAFWRTFKKQSPDVKNVYIFENGDVEVGDSNLSSAARQISADYGNEIAKVVKSKNPYFEYSNKERAYVGKPSGAKSISLATDQNRIKFLNSLGIEFKISELSKLSSDKIDSFRTAVAGIKTSIEKAEKIVTVSRKVLDIKGRLMQLSLIRAAIDNPEFDSTFFNVKGERTQTFIGTNPVSDLFDVLSQITNKRQLVNTPYEYLLTDSFSQGSVILDKIFNPTTGNRIKGGQLMHPGYADGTVNAENGKKKQSAKLTYKERLTQELNLNLKGYYYNLVPGDASMEWMVYMGNHISPTTLLSGFSEVHKVFKGYFLSELELSREDRPTVKKKDNEDLRFLKSILGTDLQNTILKEKGTPEEVYEKYASQINKAVEAFIKQETINLRELLSKYDIIKLEEDKWTTDNLSFAEGELSTDALNRQLNALTINYVINNIELHKLIYSDPYQYADELKRIKNANSPRQAIINNSPNFNKALNKMWNKGYSKDEIGYTDMTRDYFRTITSEDVISTSDLKDYGNFEETDGGGIISMKAYRWFRIKAGEWNDDEEKQYRYDIAFEKDKKNLPLSWEEQSILNGENPEVKSAYTPLKPIVFGNKLSNKNYNDVVLDKDALYPLSYRIAYSLNPESNAIKHYNKMQSEDIDYSVFHSGRKVGSEGLNSLYNEDGSFNENPYEAIINISHGIISIQSEVPSKDEPLVTRGSQITKLVTMDFMEAGVPIDFNKGGDYTKRFDEWNKLTESQKLSKSPLYKEIKNNQTLLEAITDQGYYSLLTRMGIEQTKDGNFVIKDLAKIAKTLKDEILKREVNDNIIDAFEGFKEGDVVLEATPAYQQIRNVLYSIADKNVISPKISGGQKVQIPSTLLESVRAKKEKGAYVADDNVLRFYKDVDGKRTCEIMVGRWFKSSLSDEELLNYLNNTKEGQSILSGVAYRIPTQKQNSIDSFVIKQFLPREFGDSVIIPSALVKKVGSDFDIDKLFIYFKNTFTNLKGNIKEIPFLGYDKEAKDKFATLYEEGEFLNKEQRNRLNKWIKAKQEDEAKDVVAKLATDIFGEDAFDQEVIDDFLESNSNEEIKNKIVEQMYKKSLENQYIQSLQNLISHPENFENLIKPNSAEQLKSLAKDVTKKLGFEEFSYDDPKNMLNRHFMSRLRHAFVSGKYAIGIAAVNQTNHSLNQRQPIYIDQERWDLLEAEDRFWLSGGTMNKEDVGIKFKNYNKIKIGEKEYPTLSMIKNSKGENISDIIGQFIDGYVDISKGPWIMELGASPNVASTWMFLVKLGVPIKEVAYFMNQPIIRDYLDSIENAGYVWLFIEDFVQDIKDSDKYKASPSEFKKIKEIPSNLGDLVGKEKLSPQERAQQQFILNEFLKYAKMANHMFLVTQGANWDTANFNDSTLVFKKNEQLKKAQSTIISSVNDLIKNSFIGKLSERIYDVRDAFSTILTSDSPNVRDVIEDVLRPYVDMNDRDFVKLAQKAVNDLFDWAIQNDTRLNTQIHNILLSDENTAKQMSDFVIKVRKDDKHPLHNNQVVNLLTPHFSEKNQGVNNLKIKNKDNKVYDQNQMIYAFAELKRFLNSIESPLYGSLVRLAVLQSGLSNSPISFTSLLPYKDFKEIYNKTLSTLETFPNLAAFKELDVFQRNNWNNDDLVPQRRAKKSKSGKYNTNMKFFGYKRVSKAIQEGKIPQLVKISNKAGISDSDVILYTWSTGTFAEQKEMKKKGDYSYIKKGLFKKVKQYDLPYEISYTIKDENDTNILLTDYVYKAINAWGDSHSSDGIYFGANEFYNVAKPSVIDNGFIKVENEADDATILSYFESPTPSIEGEDDSNSNLPNCS